jgi:hypothetical protein
VVGNYATWNPLANGGLTLANGNLDASRAAASWVATLATIGISSGKWYWEHTCTATQNANNISVVGVATGGLNIATMPGFTANGWIYVSETGFKYNNNSGLSYGATWTNGDVIGIAFDADNGTLVFYKNNATQGTAYTGLTSGPYFPVLSMYGTSSGPTNFGQRPFAYTAPSGFKALCTTNLPEPTIADGSTAMDVALYTGNGAARNITGLAFNPDLVWIKARSIGYDHRLADSVRGVGKELYSNNTSTETTNDSNGYVSAFNSDGFALQSGIGVNGSGNTFVAWAWDAGSSTVTNTQGSITSQVRANASAGFSVVTYSFGNAPTVGHGLGVAPSLIIAKSRTVGVDWVVYHRSLGKDKLLVLNDTSAEISSANYWGSSEPSSTVFGTIGNNTNSNNQGNMVAYCFAPVAGYSSFGSYTGNGSADGPFVYTGFRPRWIMVRRTDTSTGAIWAIWDTARNTYNILGRALIANNANAEQSAYNAFDILSNGLKLRDADGSWNGSGGTYIYYAVAENPFQYARAR